ncbi:MAG: AraC family transcriptional regulator [Planctomycetota bacterium]|jgi:AraC family transcriptional regulator|nr:AraC family transcriptional regulator [Planctomycetota bacterium]
MLDDLSEFYLTLTQEVPAPCGAWLMACGLNAPTSAGYCQHGNFPAARGRSIFQYTLEGHGHLRFRGIDYRVEPGFAMLLQPPDSYTYQAIDGQAWRFVFLTLGGKDAARHWRTANDRHGPLLALADTGPLLSQVQTIVLDRLHQTSPPDAWRDAIDAYALCTALTRELAKLEGDTVTPLQQHLRRAADYAQRNLSGPCDVDTLAAAAGMSKAHFSRRFRGHYGTAPGEYVLRLRLEHACELLVTTHRTVRTIAAACGFDDPNYFARIFRKRIGSAPLAWRSASRTRHTSEQNRRQP